MRSGIHRRGRRLCLALFALTVVLGGSALAGTDSPLVRPTDDTRLEVATLAGRTTILKLSADPYYDKFDKASLKAPAGRIVIRFKNPSPWPHDVSIRGNGVKVTGRVISGPGASAKTVARLTAGKYRFYCSVHGHEAAGMWGRLTVFRSS